MKIKNLFLLFISGSLIAKKILNESEKAFDKCLKFSKFNIRVKSKLRRIYRWSEIQKKKLKLSKTKQLLYPFGGGDILYPLVFFNEIDELIIIGLEPAGNQIVNNDKDGNLALNLRVLCEMGYCRTRQMEKIAKIGILSLMNQQLLALKAVDIKIKIIEKGFEIFFKLDGKNKKVQYYSLNLKDENKEKWFKKLKKYDCFTLFLKGSSYILQQENFIEIRDFLIKRSRVILQDDTGFKYHFLKCNKFKIKLYGNYCEPLESDNNFQIYFQKDLMLEYLKSEDDINIFDISYHEGNWLLAFK